MKVLSKTLNIPTFILKLYINKRNILDELVLM